MIAKMMSVVLFYRHIFESNLSDKFILFPVATSPQKSPHVSPIKHFNMKQQEE